MPFACFQQVHSPRKPLFTGGATGVKDGKKTPKETPEDAAEKEDTYYDAMKQEMASRAARTKSALDALDPHQRIAMEGHRPGTYLRLRFKGTLSACPCRFFAHPYYLLLCISGPATVRRSGIQCVQLGTHCAGVTSYGCQCGLLLSQ